MNNLEIVVIDDNLEIDSPLIIELRIKYGNENVKLFTSSFEGLKYILENLVKKMIVILDIKFTSSEDRGDKILAMLRKQNKLIPVIIWSGEESQEYFKDFINNQALYFVEQTGGTEEIIKRVEDAEHQLAVDLATNIELWLEKQDNKDQTIFIKSQGRAYTANDLIKEIRMETPIGRKIESNILRTTIHLLFNKEEEIND